MAAPRVRQTAYGAPLPELAEARQESMREKPANIEQRRRVQALLEDQYRELLRRHVNAELLLTIKIVNGVIQDDIYLGAMVQYRS